MFEPSALPRVFSLPPGVDFPQTVISGLLRRHEAAPPEALPNVTIYVNTRRMQRRFVELFDEGPALLLPRVKLVSDLGLEIAFADLPPPVSSLRRRLELAEIVAHLLDAQPDLAPRAAIYSLADSLANLMDEMQGEAVSPEAIRNLDVADLSGHWQRSLTFLEAINRYFSSEYKEHPDNESRQREVIERLAQAWRQSPPKDPIIVAGSTGSRGATRAFMRAVARLPQGAIILPGFDGEMPRPVWQKLETALTGEDHPQFRFARLMQELEIDAADVQPWEETPAPNPRRNALVSLALRPAPVTDQWQVEGPKFSEVDEASKDVTLIEAPSSRLEAVAISLVLREAAEKGISAALITPDRTLTRQVTAALDRWHIEPDDSAGRPLLLTAPGRLLRHVAELTGATLTGPDLLALLKHPLTNTGCNLRGEHLRLTRDLELEALRRNMPYPTPRALASWAGTNPERRAWVSWISDVLDLLARGGHQPLQDHLAQTLKIATRLVAGPVGDNADALWDKPAGQEARRIVDDLVREAPHGGTFSPPDYRDLFISVLSSGEVRDPVQPHPLIRIWGTLEARVQGVDRVILAGLNEGIWPQMPAPDPWLNRRMRHDAGLLLPERRIGLSAHDFQQAIAAREVFLTRSIRDSESQTVPSRWLNRLTNLMQGMSQDGAEALEAMRDRGAKLLSHAKMLDRAERKTPAPRPSPAPPVEARPKQLSVTRITTLVRDPYAIYAEKILGLHALQPLNQSPDAPLRGTILHKIMERFIAAAPAAEPIMAGRAHLMRIAREVMETHAPWPAARIFWLTRLSRIADTFLADEARRRERATPLALEVRGRLEIPTLGFTLTGTADRIDRDESGALFIYDYKSGRVPTNSEREHIDKQLALEAVMARAGAFEAIAPAKVAEVAYIGLGSTPKFERIAISDDEISAAFEGLTELIGKYMAPTRGYTARRLALTQKFAGDFDHLSRYGEWDHTTQPTPLEVGKCQ